jgi:hypothetical protein
VAVPARLVVAPSPHDTFMDDTVPSMSADVIVNVMSVPVGAVAGEAAKLTVGGESGRDAETVVACDREPLVPVIVIVYVAGVVELNVRVDVDTEPMVSVTLVGLSEVVTPEGVDVTEMETVPAKL